MRQHARIHVEIESDRPVPMVRADRIQIEQVLNNLVANAIDAVSERTDALGRVIIRIVRRGDLVVVQVEDNGPGVASEMAQQLVRSVSNDEAARNGARFAFEPANRAKARWPPLVGA